MRCHGRDAVWGSQPRGPLLQVWFSRTQAGFSDWILLCANPQILSLAAKYSHPLYSSKSIPVWTDDYSNLFQLLRRQ